MTFPRLHGIGLFRMAFLYFGGEPVYAGWVAVEKDYLDPGIQTLYVDPDSIRRDGNLVTVRQLTDYKWMQGNVGFGLFMMGSHRFFSTQTLKQIDCERRRVRLLSFTEFSSHMGTGIAAEGYVDKDSWLPIELESINHALWELACGKDRMEQ